VVEYEVVEVVVESRIIGIYIRKIELINSTLIGGSAGGCGGRTSPRKNKEILSNKSEKF